VVIDSEGVLRHCVLMAELDPSAAAKTPFSRVSEVFLAFLALGLTSFGGPVAHLGYFREAFVVRRQWLNEHDYGDLVALCQFLPGPASSQVGIAIGQIRAGLAGAVAAWIAFTLPSVLLLYAVALGASLWQGPLAQGVLHGLKLAALAVVAQAVWQMARKLTPDWARFTIAVVVAAVVLLVPWPAVTVVAIGAAAIVGAMLPKSTPWVPHISTPPHRAALAALIAFFVVLAALPLLVLLTHNAALDVADRFYRTGALVFVGGHVVLPLLQNELVTTGLVDRDLFLAGYGAAQAVPGPLFSFAFYAGALLKSWPNGLAGGLVALLAIYLPSFLLVLGALPYWTRLKTIPRLRSALDLANAAVVGLLLAALCTPVFTSAVFSFLDLGVATLALVALFLRAPPWLVVIACGAVGAGLARLG
jgi:chromate transporter